MTPVMPCAWYLSIVVFAAVAVAKAPTNAGTTAPRHLQVGDRIGDVLEHPAFAGFSRLLLPWDDRRYDHDERFKYG